MLLFTQFLFIESVQILIVHFKPRVQWPCAYNFIIPWVFFHLLNLIGLYLSNNNRTVIIVYSHDKRSAVLLLYSLPTTIRLSAWNFCKLYLSRSISPKSTTPIRVSGTNDEIETENKFNTVRSDLIDQKGNVNRQQVVFYSQLKSIGFFFLRH